VLAQLELMARLAALVPPPRMHLTRYQGVLAPQSELHATVTQAQRGLGAAKPPVAHQLPRPRHVAINRAKRLKRVLGIEIDTCQRCGGNLRIIARIEQPEVIAEIFSHLERTAPQQNQPERPLGARAAVASRGVVYES
jgi:pyruvate/2-oxoglutarate dehydrogenase complex dihydrolipoamide acyltransferase (E2) component